jgi:predicted kinase
MVWALLPLMVKALFEAGNDTVILDATNVTRWERDQWQSDQWETVFHFIDTDSATCAARALITDQPDVVEAIDRKVEEFEPLEEDELRYVE